MGVSVLKCRGVLGAVLVAILLMGFISPAVAEGQVQSAENAFHNITVDVAYDMMTNGSYPNLVILDVRSQYEYYMGHLYGAVLIPYDELETRINELEEHKDDEIIVYCRSGYRSTIASEILANHSFTKVYNMLGGILAWMDAGYPVWTTFHHVTVDIVDGDVLLQIEPLLPPQPRCTSCAENRTCPSGNVTMNINSTVLEQDENRTVSLLTYEFNGTTFEMTITTTLLWSYNELTEQADRTARFTSTEITTQDGSWQFYSLRYTVHHAGYNFTTFTILAPLGSETYNSSFTIMNYMPANKSLMSLEFVKFNSSVTLSQHYAVLGKVAKEVGKLYEKSGDEVLAQLAKGYYKMKEEAKHLSKIVEDQLKEYDKEILQSNAILIDQTDSDSYPECPPGEEGDMICETMYGPGYCCVNGACQPCPPGGGGWSPECLWCLIECGIHVPMCAIACNDAMGVCLVTPPPAPTCLVAAAACIICIIANVACYSICAIPCGW